jgi:hypothetical protein
MMVKDGNETAHFVLPDIIILLSGGGIKRNPLYFQYKEVGAVPTLRSNYYGRTSSK